MDSAAPRSCAREATNLKAKPARPASKPRAPSGGHAPPGLLRSAGNMAIQRMVADPLPLQRKLTIGSVDDPLEHEADRVAEQVMRMPAAREPIGSGAPHVQRKCACGGTCDSCKADEERWTMQRKSAARPQIAAGASAATTRMNAPPIVHEVLRSPGQPLDSGTRSFMEPRFGRDFSTVRLHSDAKAAESAAAVQARAYTVGNSIVLGRNESTSDLPVLAHELTHVVQQSGTSPALQRLESCVDFLEFTRRPGVSENAVRDSLATDAAAIGTVETELVIPGGSFDPWRTLPGPGRDDSVTFPQIIDEIIRRSGRSQGDGRADIGLLNGTTLEIIEVKEATWDGGLAAEHQLSNYLSKAEDSPGVVNDIWQRSHPDDQITSVIAMPMDRLDLLPNPRTVAGARVSLSWCRDGIIVFKVEEPEEEEPEEKEPEDKESDPTDLLPEPVKELGKELLKLLAADGLVSVALRFVGSFVALTPLLALAVLAFGIVYFWDQIKSVAHMIAGAVKLVWDKVSFVVGKIKDAIKELGIKIEELAVFVKGLLEDVVDAIVEGLLTAGRAVISGAKWLGGKIAEGAEAVWDWLFGDDVEPMIPNVELPITEEPTMRCGTVAREDALIQIDSDILFPFGEWELTKLTPEGQFALLKAAAKVLFTPRTDDPVRFFGFTDVIGERNQALSERRAEAVADWFVEHGIVPRSKVETRGLGETEAQAQANDEEGRKKDRRVDILVTKKGSTEKVCW